MSSSPDAAARGKPKVRRWSPPGEKASKFINALARDARGRLWLATDGDGVWRFDRRLARRGRWPWTHFTKKQGLGDEEVFAIACDNAGRIWAGHRHGVSVFNGEKWRNYDRTAGPLAGRVYDIAMDHRSGDVWLATARGLTHYHADSDRWTYVTRAAGLPSDQVVAVAVRGGEVVAATGCHGLAIRRGGRWRTVAPAWSMPTSPVGAGLPDQMVNDVLIASDGTIYAATFTGLAWSHDHGATWRFVRGEDWKKRVNGAYPAKTPHPTPVHGDLLWKDCVMSLAEGPGGLIYLGHMRRGFEAWNPADGRVVHRCDSEAARGFSFVKAVVFGRDGAVIAGSFGEGLLRRAGKRGGPRGGKSTGGHKRGRGGAANETVSASQPAAAVEDAATDRGPAPPALPHAAKAPDLATLRMLIDQFKKAGKPGPAFMGEDWQTQGDWQGRYGGRYAELCSFNDVIHADGYSAGHWAGPHNHDTGTYSYVSVLSSSDRRYLYSEFYGHRRQAEWNDGSYQHKKFPPSWAGPDLWVRVTIKHEGLHEIALYIINNDGHHLFGPYRDQRVELYRHTKDEDEDEDKEKLGFAAEQAHPPLARARVRNYYGGVYMRFAVPGPGVYDLRVVRNGSSVTKISGVFVGRLGVPGGEADDEPGTWMGDVIYQPPQISTESAVHHEAGDADLQSRRSTGANVRDAWGRRGLTLSSPGRALGFSRFPWPTTSEHTHKKRSGAGEKSTTETERLHLARKLWRLTNPARCAAVTLPEAQVARVLAYRAALADVAPDDLLANWRWKLRLWTSKDRKKYRRAMKRGFEREQKLNDNFRPRRREPRL